MILDAFRRLCISRVRRAVWYSQFLWNLQVIEVIDSTSNEQILALTDVIGSLYDSVVPLPTQVKPSSDEDQTGGQVTPNTMDQFWQRRLLVDQLTTAPHVDRMMKLLSDMKQVEGQALPSALSGQGPNSSDYFCLQGQLHSKFQGVKITPRVELKLLPKVELFERS